MLELSKQRTTELNPDFYSTQQRSLVDYSLVEILGAIISKNKDIEVLNLSLQLMHKAVDGPNRYCQQYVLDYFSSPEHSNNLFLTLERLIMTSIDSITDVIEQLSLYELNKVGRAHQNIRGKNNKLVLERINIHMEIENFEGRKDFIINIFQLFIHLMKGNDRGREFMRVPLISESGKQSFNMSLIVFSVRILSTLLKNMNQRCIQIADIIMDFILECIIGPSPDNQDEVLKTNFADCVKELLSEYAEGIELITTKLVRENVEFNRLCTKSIVVTKYLLEGNRRYETNRQMIAALLKPQYLIRKIRDDLVLYFENKKRAKLKKKLKEKEEKKLVSSFGLDSLKRLYNDLDLIDEQLTDIFEQFFVLKMICKHDVRQTFVYPVTDETEKIALDFLEACTGNIEVVFQNKIHTVYLEIQPLFKYMGKEEMDLVTTSVRRDTPKNKVIDFINLMPMVFDLISYKANLKKKGFFFSEKIYEYLEKTNFVFVFIINCLIMAFFRKKLQFGSSVTDPVFDERHVVMIVLINVHLVLMALRVLVYLLFETRVELMKQWRSIFEKIIGKVKQNATVHSELLPLSKKRFVDLKMKEQAALFSAYNDLEGNSKNLEYLDFIFQSIYMIAGLSKFKSLMLYVALTVYSYIYDVYFFYGLLLLDIIVPAAHQNLESNILNIVKSITLNANQFILTAVFGTRGSPSLPYRLPLQLHGLRDLPRRLPHVGHQHRPQARERVHGAAAVLLHALLFRSRG